MNFTQPINAGKTREKRKASFFKRLFRGLLVLILVIVGLIFVAPIAISTGVGRELVLTYVNRAIAPAHLEVEDWSLSWWDEQSLANIHYCDEKNGLRAEVKQLRMSSLWALLPVGQMRLNMTVESPTLYLATPAPVQAPVTAEPSTAVAKEKKPLQLPDWNVSLQMVIVDATLHVPSVDEAIIRKGHIKVGMPAMDQPIVAELAATLLDGEVKAKATLPHPKALLSATRPSDYVHTAELSLQAPWANVTAQATAVPTLPYPELKVVSTIPLPELMERLRSLNLPIDDIEMNEGTLDFRMSLLRGTNEKLMAFESEVGTGALFCRYEGRPLELYAKLSAAAVLDPEHLAATELARFTLELPGITANGSGSLTEGALNAHIETERLLKNLRPFTNHFELAAPLEIDLSAKAATDRLAADVKVTSQQQRVGELNLAAPGFNLETKQLGQMRLTSAFNLAQLAPFIETGMTTFEGEGQLQVAATGSFEHIRSHLVVALQNVHWQNEQWAIREPTLLSTNAAIDFKPAQSITVQALEVKTPVAAFKGAAALPLNSALAQGLTADLTGTLLPGYALEKWKVWGAKATPTQAKGEVALEVKARPNDAGALLPLVNVRMGSEAFTVMLPKQPAIDTPFALSFALKDAVDETIFLNDFNLETPYIQLQETQGTYTSVGLLDLKGTLALDLEALWGLPFLADAREAGFAITGQSVQPFTFSAPLLYGPEGIINYGKGSATIAFERILVPSLDIPEGTAALDFKDGVAALELIATVNGGDFYLQPSLNLTQQPYILTLPNDAPLLSDMNVTQEMLDSTLGVVTPLLQGATNPSGKIDVRCNNFRMELDDEPLANLETSMQIRTKGVTLRANDLLASVLILLKQDYHTELTDQQFAINVAHGILKTDPIDFRADAVRFTCSGETNLLTRELQYDLSVPLTAELLGETVSTYVREGEVVTLPIQGAVGRPRIDLDPIRELMLKTAKYNAQRKAVEALEERKQKSSNKRTQAALSIVQGLLSDNTTGAEEDAATDDVINSLFQLL